MGPLDGDAGRYRIVRRLGAGGMAEVFEGELTGEHGFSRRVAIKRIADRAATDPGTIERFLDEARIAARLHHAGIVAVLDYGVVDGQPFQVLEFVDGLDAEQLLARTGPLPVDVALIIAADVAHALDHAHRACGDDGLPLHIVHRDVKPSNVLIAWSGDVKLTDFGIAMARGRLAQTEAGLARGTLAFMAPEQRTRGGVDGRADVFALGCTLHALLTGDSPLADQALALRVAAGEPPPLDPTLPADLAALIARACAPDPDSRYPDAAALADALGPLLAQRLERDARGRLRSFLADLRQAPTRPRLFDQLVAFDLVPVDAPPGTRRFTLRPTQAGGVAPRARRRVAIATIAGGAAIAIAIASARNGASPPRAATPVDASAVAVAVSPDAASFDASIAMAPVLDGPSSVTRSARRPRIDAAPADDRTGYLQITGPELARAEVIVDGKPRGFAPDLIELPLGRHRVVLVKPDGTRLAPFAIDITAHHTATRPLRP